ncbi:MAG TPA: NADH-quinone oxidoreductase subunit N [Actinomycetota bacterium]
MNIDFHAILPELIMTGTILVVLLFDAFLSERRKQVTMVVGLLGSVAALIATLTLIGEHRSTFGGMFVVDPFSVLFDVFFLVSAIVVLGLSLRYMQDGRYYQGEYYVLLLSAFLGCLVMPSSRDLIMLFISLELVSAPGFLIAAFRKTDPKSNEAGLKYFLIGVLSSAVMLYGMSLIFGVTGTTRLDGIATALAGKAGDLNITLAAIVLVVAGFAFKVSSVPFHFWAPDTYEGAPMPVAAFLSVPSKAAGFAGLLQLMFIAFLPKADFWAPIFAVLSILTMTLGNLVALRQRQMVRLLAYSSVAQAGYMLLPFALVTVGDAGVNHAAFSSAVLYILVYGVMSLGAFAVVIGLAREAPGALIEDYSGMIHRAPVLAVAMTAFLVSLGGVPPTAGFWAKFGIFSAAIDRGGLGPWLAAIMVINSVISLGYYLMVARTMVLSPAADERRARVPGLVGALALLGVLVVIAVGIYPDLFARFPQGATLLGH